jgi:hypothetical protein
VTLSYNASIYKMNSRNPKIPLMFPNLTYKLDLEVQNIDPTGAADMIRVLVFSAESTIPLITANLSMPISEPSMDNF